MKSEERNRNQLEKIEEKIAYIKKERNLKFKVQEDFCFFSTRPICCWLETAMLERMERACQDRAIKITSKCHNFEEIKTVVTGQWPPFTRSLASSIAPLPANFKRQLHDRSRVRSFHFIRSVKRRDWKLDGINTDFDVQFSLWVYSPLFSRLTADLCGGACSGCGGGGACESSVELVCRHELLGAKCRDAEAEDGEEHGRVQDESMCIVFRESPQLGDLARFGAYVDHNDVWSRRVGTKCIQLKCFNSFSK